jgi:hypothetical protein
VFGQRRGSKINEREAEAKAAHLGGMRSVSDVENPGDPFGTGPDLPSESHLGCSFEYNRFIKLFTTIPFSKPIGDQMASKPCVTASSSCPAHLLPKLKGVGTRELLQPVRAGPVAPCAVCCEERDQSQSNPKVRRVRSPRHLVMKVTISDVLNVMRYEPMLSIFPSVFLKTSSVF